MIDQSITARSCVLTVQAEAKTVRFIAEAVAEMLEEPSTPREQCIRGLMESAARMALNVQLHLAQTITQTERGKQHSEEVETWVKR